MTIVCVHSHVNFHNIFLRGCIIFVRPAARHSRACFTYDVRTLGSSPTGFAAAAAMMFEPVCMARRFQYLVLFLDVFLS